MGSLSDYQVDFSRATLAHVLSPTGHLATTSAQWGGGRKASKAKGIAAPARGKREAYLKAECVLG
jgi:hypothetical protein